MEKSTITCTYQVTNQQNLTKQEEIKSSSKSAGVGSTTGKATTKPALGKAQVGTKPKASVGMKKDLSSSKISDKAKQGNTIETATKKIALNKNQSGQKIIEETCSLHLSGGLIIKKHGDQEVIVHKKIYDHYGKDCLAKIAVNQTVVYGNSSKQMSYNLQTHNDIVEFLKFSNQFKHIENIEKLAEGGEAIVYKINYEGYDEVVLKVPKPKRTNSQSSLTQANKDIQEGFEDLICESQLIKTIYHPDYVVEVKEEIIEIDITSNKLIRYCVFVERARYSLFDLYSFKLKDHGKVQKTGIWFNQASSKKNLEKFSIQKFFYYFYQSAKALQYLHNLGIIYSDFKPQNLLVMRNQKVKFGDFGVSILTNSKDQQYRLKGLSPQWCIQEIQQNFNKCASNNSLGKFYSMQWSIDFLKRNDIFALCLTYSTDLLNFLVSADLISVDDKQDENFYGDIGVRLALKSEIKLDDAIQMIEEYQLKNPHSLTMLIQSLKHEKKFEAAYDIAKLMQQHCGLLKDNDQINEKNQSLFYCRIYKIMGEFQFYQGNYKQAIQEFQLFEEYLSLCILNLKQQQTKEEAEIMNFECGVFKAKSYFNLGNVNQGQQALTVILGHFSQHQFLHSITEFKLMVLDLQALAQVISGNLELAKPFYLSYCDLILNNQSTQDSLYSRSSALIKLGDIFYKQRLFQDSLKYYEEAQQMLIQEYGENDPQTLDCLKQIGNIYLQMDLLEQANENFSQALHICQTIFGERNVSTAETYRQIGDLFTKKKNPKAAYYYEKAKLIYEFLYGPDNLHCAIIYNNLGGLFEQLGDLKKAEEMCMKSLRIYENSSLDENLDVGSIYSNIYQIKMKLKDYGESLKFVQLSYDIKYKRLGIEHQDTLNTLLIYVRLLGSVQKFEEAMILAQESYQKCKQKYPESSRPMVLLTQFIGQCHIKLRQFDQAIEVLNKTLQSIKSSQDKYEPELEYELLKDIGMAYEAMKDPRVVDYFMKALQHCNNLREMFGLYRSIGSFYANSKNYPLALENFLKADEVLEKNSSQPEIAEIKSKFGQHIKEYIGQLQQIEAKQKSKT